MTANVGGYTYLTGEERMSTWTRCRACEFVDNFAVSTDHPRETRLPRYFFVLGSTKPRLTSSFTTSTTWSLVFCGHPSTFAGVANGTSKISDEGFCAKPHQIIVMRLERVPDGRIEGSTLQSL